VFSQNFPAVAIEIMKMPKPLPVMRQAGSALHYSNGNFSNNHKASPPK
jgi:hypothetical protein